MGSDPRGPPSDQPPQCCDEYLDGARALDFLDGFHVQAPRLDTIYSIARRQPIGSERVQKQWRVGLRSDLPDNLTWPTFFTPNEAFPEASKPRDLHGGINCFASECSHSEQPATPKLVSLRVLRQSKASCRFAVPPTGILASRAASWRVGQESQRLWTHQLRFPIELVGVIKHAN